MGRRGIREEYPLYGSRISKETDRDLGCYGSCVGVVVSSLQTVSRHHHQIVEECFFGDTNETGWLTTA